jgi:Flp pilus assembly protein CpaB
MKLRVLALLLMSAVLLIGCQGKKSDPATEKTNQPGGEVSDEALPKTEDKVSERAPQNGPDHPDAHIQNAPRKVVLLVAKKRIPQWTRITNPRDLFERREMLESETPMEYTNKFADLQDRMVLLDIEPNRPITRNMLRDESKAGLLAQKTLRKRITVKVDVSTGGFIQPGSRVDIVQTLRAGTSVTTKMVLDNVLVQAVDQLPVQPQDRAATIPATVTLELAPEQSLKLSEFKDPGTLTLLLRPSGDASIIKGVRPQDADKAKKPGKKSGTERDEIPKP